MSREIGRRTHHPRRWELRALLTAGLLASGFLASGLLVGCAGLPGVETTADRLFAARDFAAAESAYREALRRDPTGPRQDRALYRLAVVYGLPESAVYDPEQAESCLERLLAQFPATDYELPARAWLATRRQLEEMERELAAQRRSITDRQTRLADLEARLAAAETRLADHDRRAQAATALAEDRRRRIAELEAALGRSTRRAERLERDLSELKRIDLDTPP